MDEVVGVVLAAGRGRRLGALGDVYVKTLLPIANEPVIGHHLRLLHGLDVRQVVVVVGYHADQIEAAIGTGEHYGVRVQFVRQPFALGSAHALACARPFVRGPFLLLLGDYYFVPRDPDAMMRRLAKGESAVATKRERCVDLIREACSVRTTAAGRVTAIVEKPAEPQTDLKGCGFYALHPSAFDAVTRTPRSALRNEYELTDSLDLLVKARHPVYSEQVIDWDTNITRPQDLLDCNLQWLERHNMNHLVAARAFVDRTTTLEGSVVGDGATVRGRNALRQVVVFPGADMRDFGTLERSLLTREGALACGEAPSPARG
jgi:dTDP-glucose pyrophosphorylase